METNQIYASIDTLLENYRAMKELTWADGYSRRFIALYLTVKDAKPDLEKIRKMRDKIKDATGTFSHFRMETLYFWSAILSLESQPDRVLKSTLKVYELLKEKGFRSSAFLTSAAYVIATGREEKDYYAAAQKARDFYSALREAHPLLTGPDDTGTAAVSAVSGITLETLVDNTERIYDILRAELPGSLERNKLQTCAELLAMSPRYPADIAGDFIDAVTMTRKAGVRIRGIGLPSLAMLTLFSKNADLDVNVACGAEQYLSRLPGFTGFSISRELRFVMLSSLRLAEMRNMGNVEVNNMMTQLIGLIMIQQMAAASIAAIAASAAASSSS